MIWGAGWKVVLDVVTTTGHKTRGLRIRSSSAVLWMEGLVGGDGTMLVLGGVTGGDDRVGEPFTRLLASLDEPIGWMNSYSSPPYKTTT